VANHDLCSNQGEAEVHGDDYGRDYLTDLLANRSLDFIADATGGAFWCLDLVGNLGTLPGFGAARDTNGRCVSTSSDSVRHTSILGLTASVHPSR
jgi:hypothetical protein